MAIRSFVNALIVKLFHRVYYRTLARDDFPARWGGVHVQKHPGDLIVYQEILFEKKPDLIIECGTNHGGSALFLATVCDMIGKGRIVTIDIQDKPGKPVHPRITYLHGSSTSDEIIGTVRSRIQPGESVMVILDSNHRRDHVLEELRKYHALVTPGQYLIVEDSNINGHPARPTYGPGPWEAARQFLKENNQFTVDRSREKYLVTFNPDGYLLKK